MSRSTPFRVALVLALAACGGSREEAVEDEYAAEDATMEEVTPAQTPDVAATRPEFVLTVGDVNAYRRGLSREVEALRSAQQRLAEARSGTDTLRILGEIQPTALRQEGALAAGVPEERYEQIKTALDEVLGKQEMSGAMQQMMPSAEDTLDLSPEQRARIREGIQQMQQAWGDPYAGLTPEAAEAVRARLAELSQLRAEHTGLLMGMGR